MKKHPGKSVIWNNGYKAYWAGRKLDHYQPAEWQRGWRIGQEEDEKQKDQEAARRRNVDTTPSSTEPTIFETNPRYADIGDLGSDSPSAPSDPSPSVDSGGGSFDGGGASGSFD